MRILKSATPALAALGLCLSLASIGAASAQNFAETFTSSLIGQSANGAVEACLLQPNSYGPIEFVSSRSDGMGDTLVWLTDSDGDLWACNANESGVVYAYLAIGPDLLQGQGVQMVQEIGTSQRDPLENAAGLCALVGGENASVLSFVEDGLGDVLAWVETGTGKLFMCNASPEGALYAFEAVGTPVNSQNQDDEFGGLIDQTGGIFPWQV